MGSQARRIAATASILLAAMALAISWEGPSQTDQVGRLRLAQSDWVRTKDGWERPSWHHSSRQWTLHPGVVAAFMLLASLSFLVAGSPSEIPAGTFDESRRPSVAARIDDFFGRTESTTVWTPRVVHDDKPNSAARRGHASKISASFADRAVALRIMNGSDGT